MLKIKNSTTKVFDRADGTRVICENYIVPFTSTQHYTLKTHNISVDVYNSNGQLMSKQLLEVPTRGHRVIYNSPATIVIFDDGSKGVAKCSPNDLYNRQIGYDIAHARAKIQQLENEIKRLINP